MWPWIIIGLFCLLTRTEAKLAVVAMQPEGCVPVAKGNTSTHIGFWCQVEGGVALWELAGYQINNPEEFRQFGIFINGTETHTVLTTTSDALDDVFGSDEISIRCIAFSPNSFEFVAGNFSYILRHGIPPPPAHLTITPTGRALQYLLEWSRPEGLQDCVPISYNVTVTNLVTNQTVYLTNDSQLVSGGGQQMFEVNSEECQLHEFKVVSWNDAGDSEPAVITQTLPISPNIASVSSSLTAVPVLTDGVQIEITFKPAFSCNEIRYPVVNYPISISGLAGSIDVPHTGQDIVTTLTPADFPGLQEDTYDVLVMACADFACRSVVPVTVVTNHVQYANITFLNITVSLVCVFADTSSAIGCRFQLKLSNITETVDLERTMDGGVVTQHCTTTQNMREAYLSFTVVAILGNGSVGEFITTPEDFVTSISPCELPTPEVTVKVSTLSDGVRAAITLAGLLMLLIVIATTIIIILWRKWQADKVHHLTEQDGIEFVMDETQENPTIMMPMKNLAPRSSTLTQPKRKTMAVNEAEDEIALKSMDNEPSSLPTVSHKDPVACIKIKDNADPESLQLLLKPATLAHVVKVWKSKMDRGDEMLLYWKENKEDVEDDEAYYVDPEGSVELYSFCPLRVEQNATPNSMDTCSQNTHEKALIPKAGPTIDDSGCVKAVSQHVDAEGILEKEGPLCYSHETQILLPTSFPPIDADNTIEYIPACFTPVATLSQCTHDGRCYYDEHNDFGLDIPAGAIPKGRHITIDIGVALYGPFQYPEGLRPVSPVFWVCVRDQTDYQFLKPVKITIPHCLNLKQYDDIKSLGVTFLKGCHQKNRQHMYQFQQEGNILIEPLKKYGVIKTTHFCSLCISCEDIQKFFGKASFCICSVIPEKFLPDKSSHAYFFIALLLPTCLKTVKNQIEELGYKDKQQYEFEIGSDQTLEIVLPQSLPAEWRVGMQGKKKIMMSEVDFFVNDFCKDTKHMLEVREKEGMYPPRFHVVASCSTSATQSQTRIEFKGAVTDLVFDILLTPDSPCPRGVSTSSSTSEKDGPAVLASISSGFSSINEEDGTTQLGIDDLFDVASELEDVATSWRDIGLALRLRDPDLGAIDSRGKSVYASLKDMLRLWLNLSYDVIKYGQPSWQMLENAVRDRTGGNNPAVADQIHRLIVKQLVK